MRLFHYTDEEGSRGIQSDGFICPSLLGKYGNGVYLTDLDTKKHSQRFVISALYHGGSTANVRRIRLDHQFTFEIPDTEVVRKRENVYLYPRQLVLSKYSIVGQGHNQSLLRGALAVGAVIAAGVAATHAAEKLWREGHNQSWLRNALSVGAVIAAGVAATHAAEKLWKGRRGGERDRLSRLRQELRAILLSLKIRDDIDGSSRYDIH